MSDEYNTVININKYYLRTTQHHYRTIRNMDNSNISKA